MDHKERIVISIEDAKADLDRALSELQNVPPLDPSTVGFVAHALDNYLTVTMATTDLLGRALRDHPNRDVRTWVDGLQHVTQVMQHTVGKLLQVPTAGDAPLKLEPVNLFVLMDRACKFFGHAAHSKQIGIRYRAIGEISLVHADRIAVAVVAENLLSNAVKFSPPGTTIQVQLMSEPGHVVCAVRDEGPGLSLHDQARLYQRGVTLSAVPTGGESSSGFGLALAHALVERMGGTLWCESEPGRGARFSFRLPAHE